MAAVGQRALHDLAFEYPCLDDMSEAISSSPAKRILLSLNQEHVDIVGAEKEPLPHLIEKLIAKIREECNV